MRILQENSQNGRIFFRLITLLYLVFVINPAQYIEKTENPVQEHGIGGGYPSNEIISSVQAEEFYTEISLEIPNEPENESPPEYRTFLYDSYTVQSGDNISTLAINFGLNWGTLLSVNKITAARLLQIGRVLKIPNQDGLLYTVKNGDSLSSIAGRYNVESDAIKSANELFSERITAGLEIFVPGARMGWDEINERNGDLFIWPVSNTLTSYYGWRPDPFNRSRRQFHNGIDIRGSVGTPVRAAMAGRVSRAGWDRVLGNYVLINHHSGYRTLYGHLNAIRTRTGAYVNQGERIGDVGNTGQSTGAHLHFMVYRNGVTINPLLVLR